MTDELTPEDIVELKHIRDGGTWCLDGRKERRLNRLGLIEVNIAPGHGGRGWKITAQGADAIARTHT